MSGSCFSHVAPGEGIHIHLSLVFSFIFFITANLSNVIFSSKEARFAYGQDVVFLTSFSGVANALTIWTDIFCARCLPAPNQIYFLIWPYGIFFIGNVSLFIPVKICPASKARVEARGTLKSQFSPSSLYRHSQRVMGCLL